MDTLIAKGVGTIEIKSCYGLDKKNRIENIARGPCRRASSLDLYHNRFLGVRAPPANQDINSYLKDVCIPVLTRVDTGVLVATVGGFCEGAAFGPDWIRRVFETAGTLGLRVKLQAVQHYRRHSPRRII